jgi:hypothetical protein
LRLSGPFGLFPAGRAVYCARELSRISYVGVSCILHCRGPNDPLRTLPPHYSWSLSLSRPIDALLWSPRLFSRLVSCSHASCLPSSLRFEPIEAYLSSFAISVRSGRLRPSESFHRVHPRCPPRGDKPAEGAHSHREEFRKDKYLRGYSGRDCQARGARRCRPAPRAEIHRSPCSS